MLGRIASSEERKSPTVVLKDIDMMISHKKFKLGKDRKQEIVKQASDARVCMIQNILKCKK
jgi:hypothetical protein